MASLSPGFGLSENNLSTAKVEVRFVDTLLSPDTTLWDYIGHVVVYLMVIENENTNLMITVIFCLIDQV